MKNQVIEIIEGTNLMHDIYSKAEVQAMLATIKDKVEELPDTLDMDMPALEGNIKRMVEGFEFEFDISMNSNQSFDVEINNTRELVEDIIDTITDLQENN